MMGIYSLVLLFLGILIIGLVYAKTGNHRISHHVFFAIILLLFLIIFFTIHHHFEKTCAILIAGDLDQIIGILFYTNQKNQGVRSLTRINRKNA